MSLADAQAKGLLEYIDPESTYLAHIASIVDLDSIRKAGLTVVVDSMFGAGAGYFAKLLFGGDDRGHRATGERNPAFPGMSQPEPIAPKSGDPNVGGARRSCRHRSRHRRRRRPAGRGGREGTFVTTLHSFALLCLHQLEVLSRRGPLVRSITMTSMIDRLGEIYGVPVFDTPVGFKYLGPVMMREDALIAGEESGGYAFRGSIPERDGILSGLMLLDMMVKTGKSPSSCWIC